MSNITFDTLGFSKRLEKVGFTRDHAETLASEQAKLIGDGLATKRDLKEQEVRIITRIGAMIIALGAFLAAIKFFG